LHGIADEHMSAGVSQALAGRASTVTFATLQELTTCAIFVAVAVAGSGGRQAAALETIGALTMLSVHLFGRFRLYHDGDLLAGFDSRRMQSLLALLLLNRATLQPRSQVAFLLWPDSTETHAYASLRSLLHELRRCLPDSDDYLHVTSATIGFLPGATVKLDVEEFEGSLARAGQADGGGWVRAELDRAVTLYEGDLLPTCYEDWMTAERQRLRDLFLSALDRLVQLVEAERNYESAIHYAQSLFRHDPLNERACRHLMRLYALLGDRASALRVYYSCATGIKRELDVEPEAATQEAYHLLLAAGTRGTPSIPPAGSAAPAPAKGLIGRVREWEQLQACWLKALAGEAHLVLLVGEAGIGKTRLAEELCEWAERQGIATARARGYPATRDLALAPAVAWLRARPLPSLDKVWLQELKRLLPELRPPHAYGTTASSPADAWQRRRLFDALVRALSATQPQLLMLDDLQWCDPDTLDWLGYLLQQDARARCLVVCTLRSGEVEPNSPAAQTLTMLRSRGLVAEIDLSPLNETETSELGCRIAGRELDAASAARLFGQTEGNPLFVVETMRTEMEARSSGLPARSPTIQAIIQERFGRLSPEAHNLAGLAAVIGREFNFQVLAQACDEPEATLIRALEELWQRRIIREQGVGRYDFSHDRLREEAYAGLSDARRRSWHRRVAETLQVAYADDLDTVSVQMAAHYDQAGLAAQAIPCYRRAADVAQRVYAHQDAIAYIQRALALLAAVPAGRRDPQTNAELAERLGDILLLSRETERARAAYMDAYAALPDIQTLWCARLHRKIGATWNAENCYAEALRSYRLAEATLGIVPDGSSDQDPPQPVERWQEWLQIQQELMTVYYYRDQPDQMDASALSVEPVVAQFGTPAQRTAYYQVLLLRNLRRNRYVISEETLGYARASLAAQKELDNPNDLALAHFQLGFALLWHGSLQAAEEELRTSLDLAERVGDITVQARCLTYLTTLYRKQDRPVEATELAARSLAVAAGAHMPEYIAAARANQAWLAWRAGDLATAEVEARAALEQWLEGQQVYPFHWTALWPLIATVAARNDIEAGVEYARALLEPTQLPLPDGLTSILESAIRILEQDESAAGALLRQALEWAQSMRYL
jgi:DNA-binding SARP family transcriptional activator/tetratricopeptide (TPR) repeat protein